MDLMAIEGDQIIVAKGLIQFNAFERLRHEAFRLSKQIELVEVTDENIQSSKKMLAAVNKKVKELEDRRIAIKREMLEPYDVFEKQVKEIVGIVKDADNMVRGQVRELEEQERDEKRERIAEIFAKRMNAYDFNDLFGFDDFIRSEHCNKSTSLKSVEAEIVEWLERIEGDVKVIASLPNSNDIMVEYLNVLNLATAISTVNEREERKKQLEKVTPIGVQKQRFLMEFEDERDYLTVKLFMYQNNIPFREVD